VAARRRWSACDIEGAIAGTWLEDSLESTVVIVWTVPTMLRSYQAVLQDSRLTWVAQAPDSTRGLPVVVLADTPAARRSSEEIRTLLAETRGALGRRSLDALARPGSSSATR